MLVAQEPKAVHQTGLIRAYYMYKQSNAQYKVQFRMCTDRELSYTEQRSIYIEKAHLKLLAHPCMFIAMFLR